MENKNKPMDSSSVEEIFEDYGTDSQPEDSKAMLRKDPSQALQGNGIVENRPHKASGKAHATRKCQRRSSSHIPIAGVVRHKDEEKKPKAKRKASLKALSTSRKRRCKPMQSSNAALVQRKDPSSKNSHDSEALDPRLPYLTPAERVYSRSDNLCHSPANEEFGYVFRQGQVSSSSDDTDDNKGTGQLAGTESSLTSKDGFSDTYNPCYPAALPFLAPKFDSSNVSWNKISEPSVSQHPHQNFTIHSTFDDYFLPQNDAYIPIQPPNFPHLAQAPDYNGLAQGAGQMPEAHHRNSNFEYPADHSTLPDNFTAPCDTYGTFQHGHLEGFEPSTSRQSYYVPPTTIFLGADQEIFSETSPEFTGNHQAPGFGGTGHDVAMNNMKMETAYNYSSSPCLDKFWSDEFR